MPDRRNVIAGFGMLSAGGLAFKGLAARAASQPVIASAGLPSWADQMKALEPVADKLIAKWGRPNLTEAERQDMYRLALAILSEGYLCHVYMDPKRPVWAPMWNPAYNQGGPNPDYVYMSAEVDPDGIYRISGFRGTTRFVEITQQVERILNSPLSARKPQPATNDLDSLNLSKDGSFSVIVSAERPAGYVGDWWKLHPETHMLLMRHCACDWHNEIDARVAINRLDDVEPASTEEMSRRFSELPLWIEGMISFDMELVKYYRKEHGVNQIKQSQIINKIGGLKNQFYYDGIYEIADDEALVLETTLPRKSRYWQSLVSDDRFCTVDWVNHQSSLNDVQARVDTDGKYRAIISRRDPGVPNWLDKADNAWGVVQVRFNQATDAPSPTMTKIKLSEVRSHLPADTPVVTPEERARQLADRREAAQMRRLW